MKIVFRKAESESEWSLERVSQGDKAPAFSLQAETGKLAVLPPGEGA